jgi:hypothetical protein
MTLSVPVKSALHKDDGSSRSLPPSRSPSSARTLRFADVAPTDVHVYESQPPSPRKVLGLLGPSESEDKDVPVVKLPASASKVPSPLPNNQYEREDPEEGTPEDIRRRFFPNAPSENPSLDWIKGEQSPSDTSTRYDLSGSPIPHQLVSSLPTHLGLHHHAGDQAGYTIDDLLLLSRSTVPAQRTAMLGALAGVLRNLRDRTTPDAADENAREALRGKVIAVGIEGLGEKGSLAVRATDVVWAGLVDWDDAYLDIFWSGSVELERKKQKETLPTSIPAQQQPEDLVSTLPLAFLLPLFSQLFAVPTLPRSTLSQLLQVLARLAIQSTRYTEDILSTPKLISSLLRTFLFSAEDPPDPFALQFLIVIARAGRSFAKTLVDEGVSDAVLRFVAVLPSNSPYPRGLANTLLVKTLDFYAVLGRYGYYAHIASTASSSFTTLSTLLASSPHDNQNKEITIAWLNLLEVWMTCARDPHCTTPEHEILWSQVMAWGWEDDILDAHQAWSFAGGDEVLPAAWRASAAFLEGAAVNGIKNGEEERGRVIKRVQEGFERGHDRDLINDAIARLRAALPEGSNYTSWTSVQWTSFLRNVSRQSAIANSAASFGLAALGHTSNSSGLSSPQLSLAPTLAVLCRLLTSHSFWGHILKPPVPIFAHYLLRSSTSLLGTQLKLARRRPATEIKSWLEDAIAVIPRLLPGDETLAEWILTEVLSTVDGALVEKWNWTDVPSDIWKNGGIDILRPFLTHAMRPSAPEEEPIPAIAPIAVSPRSVKASTAQRLPSASDIYQPTSAWSLPPARDWPFSPLNDLLRSGSSTVFKTLHSAGNTSQADAVQAASEAVGVRVASETDIVRATLLYARVVMKLELPLGREEILFNCMKVFMLEEGQLQNDSSEEVFRDEIVSSLMETLLKPFTISESQQASSSSESTLETVSVHFLGASKPFFQFYTDFLALYDEISFSNPLFASLLIPPLAMRYPHDYRSLFWADNYRHILRNIRIEPGDVLAGNVGEFLWPVEENPEVITAYLGALVEGRACAFLRFVAIHHVACNIWADLSDDREYRDARAQKFLRALVSRPGNDAVRDVLRYRQTRLKVGIPPDCYDGTEGGDWKARRLDSLVRWGGEKLRERFVDHLR